MAKLLAFTTPENITVTTAYWIPAQINRDKVAKICHIVFLAWKDKASKDAGKYPLMGAQKYYDIIGDEYDTWFADAIFDSNDTDPSKQAYDYADQKLDTLSGDTYVSFFHNATDDI